MPLDFYGELAAAPGDVAYSRSQAIRAALRALVARVAPTLAALGVSDERVDREGRAFARPGDGLFVRERVVFGRSRVDALGAPVGAPVHHKGLYRLDAFAVDDGRGTTALDALADALVDAFPVGAQARAGAVVVRVASASRDGARPDGLGWQQVALSIEWATETTNPA